MTTRKLNFKIMRKITSNWLMDRIVNSKAAQLGKITLASGPSLFIVEEKKSEHAKNLKENGYSVLDHKLKPEIINEIVTYSEKIKCYDDYNDPTKPIDVHNEPKETHVAHYRKEDLFDLNLSWTLPMTLQFCRWFRNSSAQNQPYPM